MERTSRTLAARPAPHRDRRDGGALLHREVAWIADGRRHGGHRWRHASRERGDDAQGTRPQELYGEPHDDRLHRLRPHRPLRTSPGGGSDVEIPAGRLLPDPPRAFPPGPARMGGADDYGRIGTRLSDVPPGARTDRLARACATVGSCTRCACRGHGPVGVACPRSAGSALRRSRGRRSSHLGRAHGSRTATPPARLGTPVRADRLCVSHCSHGGRRWSGSGSPLGPARGDGLCGASAGRLGFAHHRGHDAQDHSISRVVPGVRPPRRPRSRPDAGGARMAHGRGPCVWPRDRRRGGIGGGSHHGLHAAHLLGGSDTGGREPLLLRHARAHPPSHGSLRATVHGHRRGAPDMSAFDHSPFIAIWETTRACALACVHCRAEAMPRRDPDELTTEEGYRLLDRVAAFGSPPPIVVLTGGDPLRRPDIVSLVAYGTRQGLSMSLTPSGTAAVTRERLRALEEAGLARLAVSVDGATAETHDAFRGVNGSHRHTMRIIEHARALGLPLQINTTVSNLTRADLPELAQQMVEIKLTLWALFFLVPVGRAQAEQALSAEEIECVLHWAAELAPHVPFGVKTTEAPHYHRVLAERGQGGRRAPAPDLIGRAGRAVTDGNGFVFIDHVGNICPSGFLPLTAGNVRHDDL